MTDIKVFINDSELFLAETKASEAINADLTVRYNGKVKSLHRYIDFLEKTPKTTSLLMYCDDIEKLWADFQGIYKIVEAAGGLVQNDAEEILMIFRRGFWDLPKGKLDKGETREIAAVREVKEETGLKNVTLKNFLSLTYHTYTLNEKRILKPTHWYLMSSNDTELIPQTVEDILEVKWLKIHKISGISFRVYGSIVEVLKTVVQ